MEVLCRRLEAEGYEGFLPTTVTAPPDAVRRAIANLPDDPIILGFHLEGPFISPEYPGAQPVEYIVDPPHGDSEWDEILNDPRLRVVTLAPERPGALELTTRLMESGVIVSMGHTAATYEEARRGFEFGASHATHMFNAMRPFHHREAGTVGYALANETLFCELIYDRQHVCLESAGLLLKVKGAERVIAISDSTMATGLAQGTRVEMWGHAAILGRHDVRLENGTLAGSAITVADAFRCLHDDFGPETAIRLCCLNPRIALGMTGPPKVLLELDEDLQIVRTHESRKR
jgi:N-acetylglucosamine-6-phosphate deacetylase